MSYENRIDDIDNKGKFIFIYSDKYNIFLFFWDVEKESLFKIISNKFMEIEYVDKVEVPEDFKEFTNINFFKPKVNSIQEYNFIGVVEHDGVYRKFSIDNTQLEYEEEMEYGPAKQFNTLSCLDDIEIKAHIQRKNKIFIVGVEREIGSDLEHPIYGEVNIETGKFDYVYYLYSDKGRLELETINIDTNDLKVYVGGSISSFEEEKDQIPFIECFLLRK